jgi:hypothetical protein
MAPMATPAQMVNNFLVGENAQPIVLQNKDRKRKLDIVLALESFRDIRLAMITMADDSRIGDTVCLLHGADIPVILRKSNKDTWKCIGPAIINNGLIDKAFWQRFARSYRTGDIPLQQYIVE